ncbi:TetR family transcriptional regulator [Microbulbifer sp. CAU 1566]|uniref:TetR/AcrR family transcriptional regulator n=1 Tax=Microbulbifer sp. CAU 1566 TaxID=2933269 RepID=UPI0020044B58|nr:TetR family transcriptional regulator [Microbulbifer sp. CAU 1566]MCK7596581.1 TetR family transcriptional regulator [Microbulbifer sp. CAU 1566]
MATTNGTLRKEPVAKPAPANKKAEKREAAKAKILDATLNLIADQGLASLSHRTIAKAAGVQLAMTTYYFQTFDNLLLAAFRSFREGMTPVLGDLEQKQQALLSRCESAADGKSGIDIEQYLQGVCSLIEEFFNDAQDARSRQLKIESQFLFQQFLPEPVYDEVLEYTLSLQALSLRFCMPFDSGQADVDGRLLLAVVQHLEFSRVSSLGFTGLDNRKMIERLLRGFLTPA